MVGREYGTEQRTFQEVYNGMQGSKPWSPSNHPVDNDFTHIDTIQYLLDSEEEDETCVSDGGRTLEDMFDVLYEEDTNNPTYCLAKGDVYDFLERDVRVKQHQALDVSRKLSQGKVEDAEEKAFALLEGEPQ